ncbi:glycosyltransferase [Candidatus Scalindua japonica]|uniref:Glycosyltransferase n=2 Tax=Candidatus Scalindua japonica TaxID=1284222 RepID=A0A286U164_9BACT|nr:glycosyltransferase [Candidatus Scalindua japonica]
MIAYYFPPFGGVPVQRTIKFVKYLPKYGWHPLVLTVRDGYDHFHPNDPSLINKIPDEVEVIRTREIGTIARVVKFLNRKTKKGTNKTSKKALFTKKILKLRKLLYNTLWFPDEKNSWAPSTFIKGLRLLAKEDISIIYVSGYPWSAFLVGNFLSMLGGVPLILDFRDAWTLNPRKLWDNWLHRLWEGVVLRQASKAIFATNTMRKDYIDRYPWIEKEKFITITNGYDHDDFNHSRLKKRVDDKLLITFTGTFNDNVPPSDIDQSPYYFLQGLSKLFKEKNVSSIIRVYFVGDFGKNNETFVKEMGLENVVELKGHVSHDKSLQYQAEADLLLLVIYTCERSKSVLTGKLFEYIGARKPILALVPEGEAKDLIVKDRLGITVDPRDIDGIKDSILDFYEKWKDNKLKFEENNNVFEKYEMRVLTKKLVDVIEEAFN